LPPSVSRLSRQCGILNILQPYRPPWPVTGIALLFFFFFTKGHGVCFLYTSGNLDPMTNIRSSNWLTPIWFRPVHSVRLPRLGLYWHRSRILLFSNETRPQNIGKHRAVHDEPGLVVGIFWYKPTDGRKYSLYCVSVTTWLYKVGLREGNQSSVISWH
jgi:hypothetical protein